MEKLGYKRGIAVLLICAIGALLFIPAASESNLSSIPSRSFHLWPAARSRSRDQSLCDHPGTFGIG